MPTDPPLPNGEPDLSAPLEHRNPPTALKARERTGPAKVAPRSEHPAAREETGEVDPIVLSKRDSVRVRELLENPPESTPALMAAAARCNARA